METSILDKRDLKQLGEALQGARKRAGMTQEQAAEALSLARTTLVAIEKGERRVKATELLGFARIYGRPLSEFVGEARPAEPFEVQFRGPRRRSQAEEEEILPYIYRFEDLCNNYVELEQLMNAPLPKRYPAEYSLEGLQAEQAAENIAMEERYRLNLGDGAIPSLRDILEQDVGFRLFLLKMPSRFSEMYCYTEALGGCLAINQNHPEERRRWSMAHGYAHFLTHRYKSVVEEERSYQRMPESERFAEAFALFFLMPSSGLTRRYNDIKRAKEKITLGDLCTLAHYYWVSLEALLRRLEELRLIPTGMADKIKQSGFKVGEAKRQLGLAERETKSDCLPTRYKYLALDAFQQERIGEEQFARFMGVERLEARRIAKELQQPEFPLTPEDIRMDDSPVAPRG